MRTLVIGLILFAVACSDDESSSSSSSSSSGAVAPNGTVSSCDLTADIGYCLDFDADAPADEAKNNCLGANTTAGFNGVTNESTACPTPNRVGSCVYDSANGVKTTYRYFSPKFTTASAETNCAGLKPAAGTFSAN